jgi:hypothetical protein|tara:strand:+ start:2847 stop:3062 length:216 start_codon:yes stop_codon:yes gene_type:complete
VRLKATEFSALSMNGIKPADNPPAPCRRSTAAKKSAVMAEYAPYTVINVQSDETISHSLCHGVLASSPELY